VSLSSYPPSFSKIKIKIVRFTDIGLVKFFSSAADLVVFCVYDGFLKLL